MRDRFGARARSGESQAYRRLPSAPLAGVLALLFAVPVSGQGEPDPVTLQVLFTKNLNGALALTIPSPPAAGEQRLSRRGERLIRVLARLRSRAPSLYFDTGNALIPGRFRWLLNPGTVRHPSVAPGSSPLEDLRSAMVRGADGVRELKPAAVCPGEEDFVLGGRFYLDLMKGAGVPVICANLFHQGSRETVFPACRLLKIQGVKIVVLGVMTDAADVRPLQGAFPYRLADPIDTLEALVPALVKKHAPDLVILLSHMGIQEELDLAGHHEGIPVVLGGRSVNVRDLPYCGPSGVRQPIHVYHPVGQAESIGVVTAVLRHRKAPFRDVTLRNRQQRESKQLERRLVELQAKQDSGGGDPRHREQVRATKARLERLRKALEDPRSKTSNSLAFEIVRLDSG